MKRECRRPREDLRRWVDDDLPLNAALRVEEHVSKCTECHRYLSTLQRLEEHLHQLPRPRLTAGDQERLLQGMRGRWLTPAAKTPRRRSAVRIGWALATAAACLLAFWLSRDPAIAPPREGPAPSPLLMARAPANRGAAEEALEWRHWQEQQRRTKLEVDRSRQRVAEILLQLDPTAPVAAEFERAVLPLTLAGAPLQRILEHFLSGPDDQLAKRASQVLCAVLPEARLGAPVADMVPSLERAMGRPGRELLAYAVLATLSSPSAFRARLKALEIPALRSQAFVDLAAALPDAFVPAFERALLRLTRAPEAAERDLLQRTLEHLAVDTDATLAVLASLHREGIPQELIESAMRRIPESQQQALQTSLQGLGPLKRREALSLIRWSHDPVFLQPLVELLLDEEEIDLALQALALPRGPGTYEAFAELYHRTRESRLWRSQLASALLRTLQDDPRRLSHCASALRSLETDRQESLLSLCAALPPGPSAEVLWEVLSDGSQSSRTRTHASRLLTDLEVGCTQNDLMALLQAERQRHPAVDNSRVLGALLLALYQTAGPGALQEGCRTLGLEIPKRQQGRFLREVRLAAGSEGSRRREDPLERLARWLSAAP
jgi:hypothetical protein